MLAPLGFKKQGLIFRRELHEVVHWVGLQSSSSSTEENLKLAVNLAVTVPKLAKPGMQPGIGAAQWSVRLGFFMPIRTDKWWTIASPPDAELAAAEIDVALSSFGIPAFDTLSSISDIAALWRSGVSPGLTEKMRTQYLQELNDAKNA